MAGREGEDSFGPHLGLHRCQMRVLWFSFRERERHHCWMQTGGGVIWSFPSESEGDTRRWRLDRGKGRGSNAD